MRLADNLVVLENWLLRHSPVSQESLLPSASATTLSEVSALFGEPLHPEVVGLLSWHDGTINLPTESFQIAPEFGFIGASEAIEEWRGQNRLLSDESDYSMVASWHRRWFPLGIDWCGGLLVVDHDRSGPGYGQVFTTEPEQGARRDEGWASVSSLLCDMLRSLESGQPMHDYVPVVEDGVLIWK